jgi:catechol 2,3-dioxygenase-like lactoylglutathione lyase family enzyme
MTLAADEIVKEKGEAVGKITGVSHAVFICRDMDATVRFYRDILGLRVISTSGEEAMKKRNAADAADPAFGGKQYERPFTRQYFFELPNGEGFGFYEIPNSVDGRTTTPLGHWYWPGTEDMPPRTPHKLDHFAFHVPTLEDVEWFAERLVAHGVEVIGPFAPRAGSPTKYTHRIYFWDPNGIPLEIATQVEGQEHFPESAFFLDTKPVAAMLEK